MAADPTTHHAGLETILPKKFRKKLSEAERRLLRAVPEGNPALCGPPPKDNKPWTDPEYDPVRAEKWGPEREIRAALIRWLCVDREAAKRVDPHGVSVYGAKITGNLDLSFTTIPFPLRLSRCRLAGACDIRNARAAALYLDGSVTGPVTADEAEIRGSIFLNDGFHALGRVRLVRTQIGGDLVCNGGTFENPTDYALVADSANIGGYVFLRDVSAKGEMNLLHIRIGSNLECSGNTRFSKPGGMALNADSAEVKGSVFLKEGFSAEGDVRLAGARIENTLNIAGWKAAQDAATLDLRNASAGALWDNEVNWPQAGRLHLDGFGYRRFAGGPTDAPARLRWLRRQGEFKPQPYRQLAKVLREMGDDEGAKQVEFELEGYARADERKRLAGSPVRWLFREGEDALSNATVGYGIYPGRAVRCLTGLTALGWLVYWRAQRMKAMAPNEKEAYKEFRAQGRAPDYYAPFNPFIYSLENCVPLVKFGQDDHWQPDPNPAKSAPRATTASRWARLATAIAGPLDRAITPTTLRWLRWIMIALGWLLATFFVAGVSGIIKTG